MRRNPPKPSKFVSELAEKLEAEVQKNRQLESELESVKNCAKENEARI
jgi:hypothetical protein